MASIGFVSQDVMYEKFRTEFADRPEFLENVTPDVMPSSYQVSLVAGSTEDDIARVADDVEPLPGVREVHQGTPPFLRSTIEVLDGPTQREPEPDDLQRRWRAWTTSLHRIAATTPESSRAQVQEMVAFHEAATRSLEAARWTIRSSEDPEREPDVPLDRPRGLVDAARSVERDVQQRCEAADASAPADTTAPADATEATTADD